MPSFLRGQVTGILHERPGLQRVEVLLDGEPHPSRAVNYPGLIGPVAVGDAVVCNTTAIELALGTGGEHFVYWNLSRSDYMVASGGHIMKLRYTPVQVDVHAVEEDGSALQHALIEADSVDRMPVVAASLHSMVAPIVAGIKHVKRDALVGYVMTDGGALPLPLSDLVAALRGSGLLGLTISAGNAFGGELEAVNVASGLLAARLRGCDAAIVAMGPGVVGTSTRFGSTAWELAGVVDTMLAIDARPVVAVRASLADFRARHRGISHHTLTSLRYGGRGADRTHVDVVVPQADPHVEAQLLDQLTAAGVTGRYHVVRVDPGDALDVLAAAGVEPTSMGRTMAQDPLFWRAGAAAGVHAGRLIIRGSGGQRACERTPG